MNTAEIIYNQVKTLPESMAREVLDFVGYLKGKQEYPRPDDLMLAQESVLLHIWDNTEDEVWKDV
ncbi:MAG: DUF2281 domain-containing protein [Proteobacteria bacterium]|nr:DUF2281 domain-containing protein [Desulfobulbaceae bacterium]MBU4153659.1 DUF2281 domain-containing protein [Pseudomonadota bacterium]